MGSDHCTRVPDSPAEASSRSGVHLSLRVSAPGRWQSALPGTCGSLDSPTTTEGQGVSCGLSLGLHSVRGHPGESLETVTYSVPQALGIPLP